MTKPPATTSLAYRIFRELFALCLWCFAFIKVFVFDVDVYVVEKYASSFRWVLDYKFFFIIGIMALLCLLFSRKKFRGFTFYIIGYPLVVICYWLPLLLLRHWPTPVFVLPVIHDIVTNFRKVNPRLCRGTTKV